MAHSEFDTKMVGEIIRGHGTWYNARLIRALNDLLPYADAENRALLEATWPDQCKAILDWWAKPSEGRE